ncbi:MAG: hypothetical protein IIA67_05725 [Planctomycetes bacterium]|nr:hypothetical protein [Planctomycetota bacterium]
MSESTPDKPKKPLVRVRRLTGWTCNVLATLIILYGGWIVGREMIGWWGEPASDDLLRQAAWDTLGRGELADPNVPHTLQTSDMDGSLGHQRFSGDRKAAMAELRRRCRTIAQQAAPPVEPPRASEVKMLATLGALSPLEQGRTARGEIIWEIFQLDGPLPMVAATHKTAALAASGGSGEVAPLGRRVVCWGLAMAASENEWTLFTYHPSGGSIADAAKAFNAPLPPGAEGTLTLRAEEGGALVGFRQRASLTEQNSNETLQAWMQFYDQWFAGRGYTSAFGWRDLQGSWHARFEHIKAGRIEVQLTRDRDHNISGTLVLTPAPPRPRE